MKFATLCRVVASALLVASVACSTLDTRRGLKSLPRLEKPGRSLQQYQQSCGTLSYIVGTTPELSTLLAALNVTGLLVDLDDPYLGATLFAPTNTAFAALAEGLNVTTDALLAEESLLPVLLYHILPGVAYAGDFINGLILPTLLTENITVLVTPTTTTQTSQQSAASPTGSASSSSFASATTTSENITVVGAESTADVVQADILSCSGVVHEIDAVLVPDILSITNYQNGTTNTTKFVVGDGTGNAYNNAYLYEVVYQYNNA